MTFKAADAQALLDNPILIEAMHEVREYHVQKIEQNPLETVESAMILTALTQIKAAIESHIVDGTLTTFNKEQSIKYQ